MVEKIMKHYRGIVMVVVVFIGLFCSMVLGQFINGRSAEIIEIERLKEAISERIAISNKEFEHIEQAITTVTMRMTMWQDSNAEFVEMRDCLMSMTTALERIATAQEELAGL